MTKLALIVVGVLIAVSAVVAFLCLRPIIHDRSRSASQMQALQSRSDYPEIATACVGLAHSDTNLFVIPLTDPRVPTLLKSLSPSYIAVASDEVTLEFHGGFDHYGYRVRQSTTNAKQWTMYYYTEEGQKPLVTVESPNTSLEPTATAH